MKPKQLNLWIAAFFIGLGCVLLPARGESSPGSILDSSNIDNRVLAAPTADFSAEVVALNLPPSKYRAVTNGTTFTSQTLEAELLDLTEALQKDKVSEKEIQRITNGQRAERIKLKTYLDALADSGTNRPIFPRIFTSTRGLPDDFSDYFEGAVAWKNPAYTNSDDARQDWHDTLNLPPSERRYKSTWAAFMLGKSYQKDNPARAITYFQRVRDLADHGYADSLGLAAASLGLEAQTDLQQGKFAEAIELYLQQLQTGDPSASPSLRITASAALNKLDVTNLASLATNSQARRVITAHLISRDYHGRLIEKSDAVKKWLAAVEIADTNDIPSAGKLALAAYQAGDWDAAERWINRAPMQPVNQWLQAKLFLRDRKIDQAAEAYAKAAALFPTRTSVSNAPHRFEDGLFAPSLTTDGRVNSNLIPGLEEILGETGIVLLAQRDYAKALDALVRSGFSTDAAYVANRVLTADELKDYVDRNCPSGTNPEIRDLLARRLARLGRLAEARLYYGDDILSTADKLAQALARGTNDALPQLDRARAFFVAAQTIEIEGRDLLGENLDQNIYDNTNVIAGPLFDRSHATLLAPSEDELKRVAESAPDPNVRLFYHFQAADLAWKAALLLPDNSEETARVLCEAGTWIKYLDPKKADVFYKALVRRCRNTALGETADRKRWFPQIDADGNMLPGQ